MRSTRIFLSLAATVLAYSVPALATDLTLHLNSNQPVTRQTIKYQCDAQGASMGLPAGPFSVEYVNGAGNSLVIVPLHGGSLIFTNVMSADGARYAAQTYIWWEAGGSTSLSNDSLSGNTRSECHRVP